MKTYFAKNHTAPVIASLMLFAFAAAPVSSQTSAPQSKPPVVAPSTKPAAAKSTEKLPTADQLFDKYTQAIGGQAAYRKLNSRVARGTFVIAAAGINAPVEIYQKAPNKIVTLINLPGFGAVTQGFDGKIAYDQQPTNGLRELSGKELAKRRRQADFYNDLNLKGQYSKTVVTGVETVGTSQAYRVDATTPEGDIEKLYFDKLTGLLVRKDEASETPEGLIPSQSYYEDYRTIDGIKFPFLSRITSPAVGVITVTFSEVKHNVPVEDAKFNKPAAQ